MAGTNTEQRLQRLEQSTMKWEATCNREQSSQDHDKLIKNSISIENNTNDILELRATDVAFNESMTQLNTSLNLTAAKVTEMYEKDNTQSAMTVTIISTVIAALIIGFLTFVGSHAYNSITKQQQVNTNEIKPK